MGGPRRYGRPQRRVAGNYSGVANYITTKGFKRLHGDLHTLLSIDRPHMVSEVATAAAHGDRSENAEYIYGKKKLRAIDRRIHFLTKRLESAIQVDPTDDRGEKVFFGATVVLEDEDDRLETVQLVGEDEIDPGQRRISWRSPVGRALLGRALDDDVRVVTPAGVRHFTIVQVEYK